MCYSKLISTNVLGWKILGSSIISLTLRWFDLISSLSCNWLQYVLDILTKVGMLGLRPYPFPMEQQHRLSINSGSKLPNLANYYCSIRCLIYFTITRVELSSLVHILYICVCTLNTWMKLLWIIFQMFPIYPLIKKLMNLSLLWVN